MSMLRVLSENYLETATQTYSSQQTLMPASNVIPGSRRSHVWRSNGYWVVTSANKGIVLRTTVGIDQTVNIAEATYTSDSSFLTAVKAALDSEAYGATFTVTRDTTTNAIKMTSDLGGTSTIFSLMCTNASFTSASLLGFSTVSDLTGAATYTADTVKLHSYEWIKWDLGTSANPTAFCLIGLRNSAFKLSATATIKLQGSTTDSWTSPEYDQTLTYSEFGVGIFSTTGLHTSALRYWRLYIEDKSNAYGYVEISKVFLGEGLDLTRGSVQYPLRTNMVDYGEKFISRGGVTFHDSVQLTETIELNWNGLTKSEKDDMEDFVRLAGMSESFFLMMDPDEVFSDDSIRHLRLVKFDSGPSFSLISPNNFSSDWTVREEV